MNKTYIKHVEKGTFPSSGKEGLPTQDKPHFFAHLCGQFRLHVPPYTDTLHRHPTPTPYTNTLHRHQHPLPTLTLQVLRVQRVLRRRLRTDWRDFGSFSNGTPATVGDSRGPTFNPTQPRGTQLKHFYLGVRRRLSQNFPFALCPLHFASSF